MLNPGDRFGDYTVARLLGQGGMGAVFLLESANGGQVAAKILDPASAGDHESRKRFLREAELALGVKHPNLVETYDVGEDPETGLCYILMEYVPGGSLADRLEKGPLPVNDAIRIVYQIASVLELARQKGIVHRDIKPANIMFGTDGQAKLADLGIARGGVGGANVTTVTQTGMMIGTPAYMAPEQMLDAHHVDSRADIYSLGIVFYEMLAGKRPNADDTVVQLMAKAVAGEPIPDVRTMRPEVSAAVAELISLMCAMKADERVATPREVTTALSQIAHGREVTIRRKAPKVGRSRKSFLWKVLIPAGLLAGLAAAFAILAPKREQARPLSVAKPVEPIVKDETKVDKRLRTSARRTEDGVYRWKGPEGVWTYRVRNGLASIGDGKGCALYPRPRGRLTIPATISGLPVEKIAYGAFQGCKGLTAVVISEGILEMDRDVFKDCATLADAALPASMKKFGTWNFFGAPIRSLNLGRIDYWDGRIIGGMTNLVELKFDSFNENFVCEDGMVRSRDKTRLLFSPRSKAAPRLPADVTTLDAWALCGEDVTVPRQITHVGPMAFGNCHVLRHVRFESPDVSIGYHAFHYAVNLRQVDFPEGLREICAPKVFSNCSSLQTIRFPASVRRLGSEMFANCSSLRTVAFDGDAPELVDDGRTLRGRDIFRGTPRDLVVTVKRGSRGWNPNGDGLPKFWPVGAGNNARRIRYADDEKTSEMPDAKVFDWLEHPPRCASNAEVLVGFCPKWQKPNKYFASVAPGTKVRYVQNREMEACDMKNTALVFMFSCDAPDYETEARNVRRCLDRGLSVVFVAHTPNDVRERLLDDYGLHFSRIPDGVALECVCPGLRNVPMRWQPMGKGRILNEHLGWRPMIAAGDDRRNVIFAMRPIGKGRLFFLAESRRPRVGAGKVDFGWWNRVLLGCGIGVCDPVPAQTKRIIDPSRFHDEDPTRAVQKAIDAIFPGWKTSEMGNSGTLGYWRERDGEADVVCTHPPRRGVPAVLSKTLIVQGKSPVLHVRIANNDLGSQFRLRVRVAGEVVREKDITSGWTDVYVDLRRWRGKKVKLELEHLPTGWSQEWAFWSKIEIVDDAVLVDVASVQDKDVPVKMFDRKKVVGATLKKAAQRTCDVLFPGWRISECGHLDEVGYEEEHAGRCNLLFTHPPSEEVPVVISRRLTLPRNDPKLHVSVIGGEDFELQVRVNGKVVQSSDVNGREWTDLTMDLSEWAGRTVLIEALNMPNGWRHEEAHWQRLEIK